MMEKTFMMVRKLKSQREKKLAKRMKMNLTASITRRWEGKIIAVKKMTSMIMKGTMMMRLLLNVMILKVMMMTHLLRLKRRIKGISNTIKNEWRTFRLIEISFLKLF